VTIAGVIVAAGESTRMGRPKQLLTIGDRPLLQWVVDAAEASTLDRVVVVTGHAAGEVRSAVTLERAVWAHNSEPGRGTMSSLRSGMINAGEPEAVMKLVCDQPEVTTAIINTLAAAWVSGAARAAVVQYRDGPGHPMLFSKAALGELLDRDGDRLLWSYLDDHPHEVVHVAVDQPRPIDVNAPGDLEAVATRLGYGPPAPPTA
jgi:molybdenum cofactor cytidylyltransferase